MSVTVNGMFVLGNYKTRCGLPATVAKLAMVGTSSWILHGSITATASRKVLVLHKWSLQGKSLLGDPEFDLVSEDEYEQA